MVGQLPLEQHIGVRIPGGNQWMARTGEQIETLRSADKTKISALQAYRQRPQFLSGLSVNS
jgi:hypothetical protein